MMKGKFFELDDLFPATFELTLLGTVVFYLLFLVTLPINPILTLLLLLLYLGIFLFFIAFGAVVERQWRVAMIQLCFKCLIVSPIAIFLLFRISE